MTPGADGVGVNGEEVASAHSIVTSNETRAFKAGLSLLSSQKSSSFLHLIAVVCHRSKTFSLREVIERSVQEGFSACWRTVSLISDNTNRAMDASVNSTK